MSSSPPAAPQQWTPQSVHPENPAFASYKAKDIIIPPGNYTASTLLAAIPAQTPADPFGNGLGGTIQWDLVNGALRGQSSGSLPYEYLTLIADSDLRQTWYRDYWVSIGGAAYDAHEPVSANGLIHNV